jgi:hypothetical protein
MNETLTPEERDRLIAWAKNEIEFCDIALANNNLGDFKFPIILEKMAANLGLAVIEGEN